MSEWRDISTAPKNGQRIRVKFHSGHDMETYWIEPTFATAGWFPWHTTRGLTATGWKPLSEDEQ